MRTAIPPLLNTSSCSGASLSTGTTLPLPPYLEAVSSIRNPRARYAVVTGTHMTDTVCSLTERTISPLHADNLLCILKCFSLTNFQQHVLVICRASLGVEHLHDPSVYVYTYQMIDTMVLLRLAALTNFTVHSEPETV
jgi:hypothetical protein